MLSCVLFVEIEHFANSTELPAADSKDEQEVKLKLIEMIKSTSKTDATYRKSMKNINWSDINIPGYSKEKLQDLLNGIVKKTGYIRTLDEILTSYSKNQFKLELSSHPDKPSKPKAAYILYFDDNKEKFTSKFQRENPDDKVNFFGILKMAREKFNSLADKKKQPYITRFENEKRAYDEKVKEFETQNSHLFTKLNKEKKINKKNPVTTALTPFGLYREEVGGNESFQTVKDSWNKLPNAVKLIYIQRVVADESDIEKKITKAEMKIIEEFDGIPKKPNSAYAFFFAKFKKSYRGENKDLMKSVSEAWQTLSEKEKAMYKRQYDQEMIEYGLKLEAYIATLPPQQQVVMKIKHKNHLPKSLDASIKKENSSINGSPAKKRPKIEDEDEEVERSPKKSPSKKLKMSALPEYPSQTTAHYYLVNVHNGDEKKARKAYKKLDDSEKKVYRKEMEKKKKSYLQLTSMVIGKMAKSEVDEYKKVIEQSKIEQAAQTSWHRPTETDDEEESSSGSEEDSD